MDKSGQEVGLREEEESGRASERPLLKGGGNSQSLPEFRSRDDLEKCRKSELVSTVMKYQRYLFPDRVESPVVLEPKGERGFDWEKYSVRHIALHVAYLGWDYAGLSYQKNVELTIENVLVDACKTLKLIQDIESSNWQRAGRTDKGVSSVGQVISVQVRSRSRSGIGVTRVGEGIGEGEEELDYVAMLNGVLPSEIRVLGWKPVPDTFSARFSAIYRIYKYYFAREEMDLEKMREGAKWFLGEHDFRNFCKMDAQRVSNYKRYIIHIDIEPADDGNPVQLYQVVIQGSAFLWHQVRCMVQVLFMVGKGFESPEVIREMLDLEKYPKKPIYPLASERALVLESVGYFQLQFEVGIHAQRKLIQHIRGLWTQKAIESQISRLMFENSFFALVNVQPRKKRHVNEVLPCQHSYSNLDRADFALIPWADVQKDDTIESERKKWTPMTKRPREDSYEERIDRMACRLKKVL
ncbi:tRNA pseudouridine(38/39) synthase-like [Schistocerca gregaria]|uniref:tRNA pseudouridine(38/39) synthase-like n=1 Tax=Schistocerca gregaria TaxID=7010 RepID=UPI00211E1BBD|nr:tRNA pseudouridine(38/39) synthase-like [Schistocerca gregaria]